MYPLHSDLIDLKGSHRFKTYISVGLLFRKPHLFHFSPFASFLVTQDISEDFIASFASFLGHKEMFFLVTQDISEDFITKHIHF